MKRGEIVTVAAGSGFGGKPRPALVIQDDAYLDISTVILALISSDERAAELSLSVPIDPTAENGLRRRSYLMPHELVMVPTEEIGKLIGRLESDLSRRFDRSLIMFLGLDRA